MQADQQHQTASQDHDHGLNGVPCRQRRKPPMMVITAMITGQRHTCITFHPSNPCKTRAHGVQVESHFGHDADRQHQPGEIRPGVRL